MSQNLLQLITTETRVLVWLRRFALISTYMRKKWNIFSLLNSHLFVTIVWIYGNHISLKTSLILIDQEIQRPTNQCMSHQSCVDLAGGLVRGAPWLHSLYLAVAGFPVKKLPVFSYTRHSWPTPSPGFRLSDPELLCYLGQWPVSEPLGLVEHRVLYNMPAFFLA